VRSGRAVSLSREFPKTPALNNPTPAQHYMKLLDRGAGGAAIDYYGVSYHGQASTHLDSLCHVWNEDGMWNGRAPADEISFDGARFGAITNWSTGIITRGVLLDVPRFRGEPFVTQERPIHGWELEDVAAAQGVALEPGDALVVYGGREAWDRVNPIWGSGTSRPGLHASCLPFIRDNDASLLVWDMMDHSPNGYDVPWSVHGVIFAYGVGLVDNALLEPLAAACAEEGRYEFMLMVLPLVVVGGTGSPANPVALF
jgi:kynurenine formamidase